jgi:hypothetical protein
MRKKFLFSMLLSALCFSLVLSGCTDDEDEPNAEHTTETTVNESGNVSDNSAVTTDEHGNLPAITFPPNPNITVDDWGSERHDGDSTVFSVNVED